MRAAALLALAILATACNAGPRVEVHEEEEPTSAPAPVKPASNWEYKVDGHSYWACAHSVDNAAELCFRREQGRLDSFLHLPSREGNPFFCSRGRCVTKIRIDDAAERTVEGTDDEGGGTRILFLPAPEKLLHEVEQAREVRVKPPMFGVDQEFDFQVAGLKWP